MRQHLFIHCSLEMTEFRPKLVRQPELHQPPWSLLLVPRMTPQANGEERHDLEPTMPREEYQLPHLAGGVSSQKNAFAGSARTQQSRRRNAGEMVTRAQPFCCSLGRGMLTWVYPQGESSLPFFRREGHVQEGMGGRHFCLHTH